MREIVPHPTYLSSKEYSELSEKIVEESKDEDYKGVIEFKSALGGKRVYREIGYCSETNSIPKEG